MIEAIAARRPIRTYLEIGVLQGQVFLRVAARRKIAVDPHFEIGAMRRLYHLLRRPGELFSRYFEMSSDEFFARHASTLGVGIDLAFVDGLHRREQVLIDVENCLRHLATDGVVLVHDCNPPNPAAALPADSPSEARAMSHPDWTGEWTGDVYKAVIELRARRRDLDVFVVDTDYGVGVVTRGGEQESLSLSNERLRAMSFDEFSRQRNHLLNLKSVSYFLDWLNRRFGRLEK